MKQFQFKKFQRKAVLQNYNSVTKGWNRLPPKPSYLTSDETRAGDSLAVLGNLGKAPLTTLPRTTVLKTGNSKAQQPGKNHRLS